MINDGFAFRVQDASRLGVVGNSVGQCSVLALIGAALRVASMLHAMGKNKSMRGL